MNPTIGKKTFSPVDPCPALRYDLHMFYVVSLLVGALISVMVAINGKLTAAAGRPLALVLIHLVAFFVMALVMAFKKEKPSAKGLRPWQLSAGLIGLLTTTFNNLAFGRISVSAIMALALLGESISGLLADHFGLLGLPVRKMQKGKLLGAPIMALGILVMLDSFDTLAVIVSLLAGFTILFSRLLNGQVTRQTSVYNATFINYGVGFVGAVALFFMEGGQYQPFPGPVTLYLGGLIGVVAVLATSAMIGRIASFYMTLALFVGQVAASVLLDVALSGVFSLKVLLGGVCVLLGLILALIIDRRAETKNLGVPG
jgi:transporter family-2 protein